MNEAEANTVVERAADEAAGWFVRLNGEQATGSDWIAFESWLRAAPENRAAYEYVEALWVELEAFAPLIPSPATTRRDDARRVLGKNSRRGWIVVGAALAASVVLAVFVANRPSPVPVQTYRTAAGETRDITLSDGTHIRLNAASSIRVALGRDQRQVAMADAEAAFDVAHDPRRPFQIKVGDQQVRVVGTEFNIRHRDGATAVTVRRGIVEVRPLDQSAAAPKRLVMAQELNHRDGSSASTIRAVEPDAAFGWTQGQLIYRDAPMSQVAADLSRQFGVTVHVADAKTAQVRFTGVLVTDSLAPVLRRLEAYAPIRSERLGDEVLLRRRGAGT